MRSRPSHIDDTGKVELLSKHKRFYVAMILNDIIHEMAPYRIIRKYRVLKGSIQTLKRMASMFGNSLSVFCQVIINFYNNQILCYV